MRRLTSAGWRVMPWWARMERDRDNRRVVMVAAKAHHARYHRVLCECPYRYVR